MPQRLYLPVFAPATLYTEALEAITRTGQTGLPVAQLIELLRSQGCEDWKITACIDELLSERLIHVLTFHPLVVSVVAAPASVCFFDHQGIHSRWDFHVEPRH